MHCIQNSHLTCSTLPLNIIIFGKHVKTHSNPDGFIEMEYCATVEQVADIFIKPVRYDIFFKLRLILMNW
jgi:hypothetical protein